MHDMAHHLIGMVIDTYLEMHVPLKRRKQRGGGLKMNIGVAPMEEEEEEEEKKKRRRRRGRQTPLFLCPASSQDLLQSSHNSLRTPAAPASGNSIHLSCTCTAAAAYASVTSSRSLTLDNLRLPVPP
jgi:hypothetical protein